MFFIQANIQRLNSVLKSVSKAMNQQSGTTDMENEEIKLYLAEVSIIKEMFEQGIIDEADYLKAEVYLAKKHCINDKSIFRLNKLINDQDYGMYIGEEKEDKNDSNKEDRIVTKIT